MLIFFLCHTRLLTQAKMAWGAPSFDWMRRVHSISNDFHNHFQPARRVTRDATDQEGQMGTNEGPHWFENLLFSALTALNVEVVMFNLLIIIHVLRARNFQKSSSAKYFVLSLAVSDLIVGAVVLPFGIVSSMLNRWIFGSLWCELWQTFDFFACTASILNMVTISIDR